MTARELARLRRSVATASGEAACVDIGSGPAALFVHGAFLNAFLWAGVVSELAGERRCVAVDLPGHGATGVAPGQDLSLAGHADLLVELCDALELDRVDLVGNDSGSAISQVLAARHPHRLRTLTLTNGETPYELPHETLLPAPIADLARDGALAGAVEQMLADEDFARSDVALGVGFEDPARLTSEAIEAFLAPLVASPESARAFQAHVAGLDAAGLRAAVPALRSVQVPTLVVWGTGDEMFGRRPRSGCATTSRASSASSSCPAPSSTSPSNAQPSWPTTCAATGRHTRTSRARSARAARFGARAPSRSPGSRTR